MNTAIKRVIEPVAFFFWEIWSDAADQAKEKCRSDWQQQCRYKDMILQFCPHALTAIDPLHQNVGLILQGLLREMTARETCYEWFFDS